MQGDARSVLAQNRPRFYAFFWGVKVVFLTFREALRRDASNASRRDALPLL